jgi:DNA-nicking Smr family endonuclease
MTNKRDTPSFMSRNFPDARPLRQNRETVTHSNKKPINRKQQAGNLELDDIPPLQQPGDSTIVAADTLCYQGNGVQNRLMKQLKQGGLSAEERLDLHGQTVEQAYQSIMQFIHYCQQHRIQNALIIHGQGYRSAGGVPVLKQNVDYWLRQHDSVLAFHSATPADGGKGAVYVLIRKGPV